MPRFLAEYVQNELNLVSGKKQAVAKNTISVKLHTIKQADKLAEVYGGWWLLLSAVTSRELVITTDNKDSPVLLHIQKKMQETE